MFEKALKAEGGAIDQAMKAVASNVAVNLFVDYELPNARNLFLPQSSNATCWAACAAGIKSGQAKRMVKEEGVLTGKYLDAFKDKNGPDPDNPGRELLPAEMNDLYNNVLKFKSHLLDLSSRLSLAILVSSKAPIIVMSAIVDFPAGKDPECKGYHVRLVYGVRGKTGTQNEDDLEVKVFDPFPPTGYKNYQPFPYTLFKYQMTLKIGNLASMVGQCWYA